MVLQVGVKGLIFKQGNGSKTNVDLVSVLGQRAKIVEIYHYASSGNVSATSLKWSDDDGPTNPRFLAVRQSPTVAGFKDDQITRFSRPVPVMIEEWRHGTGLVRRQLLVDVTFTGAGSDGNVLILYTTD